MPKMEKVLNSKGVIVEVEVLTEEEYRQSAGQYRHNGAVTLRELTEQGFVPLVREEQ